MVQRRFYNETGFPIMQPDQGVTIEPGKEGVIDMPADHPVPWGLIETSEFKRDKRKDPPPSEVK